MKVKKVENWKQWNVENVCVWMVKVFKYMQKYNEYTHAANAKQLFTQKRSIPSCYFEAFTLHTVTL